MNTFEHILDEKLDVETYCAFCHEKIKVLLRVTKQEHLKLDKEYCCSNIRLYTPERCPHCGARLNYVYAAFTNASEVTEDE